jgi:hypothetical protein
MYVFYKVNWAQLVEEKLQMEIVLLSNVLDRIVF